FFVDKAFQVCSTLGIMVSEVATARKNGASIEQVKTLLGDRYGNLAKTYHGGTEKLAATYSESSSPENGFLNYVMCMESGRRSN
ncbi:MAG TPA: hypothetical protein PLW86_13160, partial [Rhodocyclaceae bacterium]|nr:hypothetical protein [Rhodocyclaceae bacterium]